MEIIINYESSWRNSFLDGDNNSPLPKKGRNFIASIKELKNPKNYIERNVTLDTVMGVLNRLIGDQRKLYQSRADNGYYFSAMEKCISFIDNIEKTNQEIAFIRNMNGSNDQNSFTGMIMADVPIFQSDYSKQLWGVLSLNIDELLIAYKINGTPVAIAKIIKIKIPLDGSDANA